MNLSPTLPGLLVSALRLHPPPGTLARGRAGPDSGLLRALAAPRLARGPEKGKFRTFLLACLTNYLRNEHAKASGPRRNPGQPILPIDWDTAEQHYHAEPADGDDPSKAFERNWACALIEQVLNKLKASCAAEGKAEHFDALHSHLIGDANRGDFASVAARLNISEGAARVAATRLRAQFRDLLRAEIAATVEHPADIDAEIAALFSIFSR